MNRDRTGSNWSELKRRPEPQLMASETKALSPFLTTAHELLNQVFYKNNVVKQQIASHQINRNQNNLSQANLGASSYSMVNIMPLLKSSQIKK